LCRHHSCSSVNLSLSSSDNSHDLAFPNIYKHNIHVIISCIFGFVGQKMVYSVFKSLLPSIQNTKTSKSSFSFSNLW
jgi:hypothetical protein